MSFLKTIVVTLLCVCGFAEAQLLPDNSTLNVQSVQRWMDSNRDFKIVIETVDTMFKTEEQLSTFDLLPPAEQDEKINRFLQQQKMFEAAKVITYQRGWKSVGEYRRLSTKLGNAIAAGFLASKMNHLTADEKKTLREKSDPAVVAVPPADIAFVKTNEKLLKQYIQAYAATR
ncbi:MAG: hypothetical protein V4660_00330 [Pseudomonadota bacterium]